LTALALGGPAHDGERRRQRSKAESALAFSAVKMGVGVCPSVLTTTTFLLSELLELWALLDCPKGLGDHRFAIGLAVGQGLSIELRMAELSPFAPSLLRSLDHCLTAVVLAQHHHTAWRIADGDCGGWRM
jgi:hypothetical protein